MMMFVVHWPVTFSDREGPFIQTASIKFQNERKTEVTSFRAGEIKIREG
jgi:hypothetical protein